MRRALLVAVLLALCLAGGVEAVPKKKKVKTKDTVEQRYQMDYFAFKARDCVGYDSSIRQIFKPLMRSVVNANAKEVIGKDNVVTRVEVVRCRLANAGDCAPRIRLITYTIPLTQTEAETLLAKLTAAGYNEFAPLAAAALLQANLGEKYAPRTIDYLPSYGRVSVCLMPPDRRDPNSVCALLAWNPLQTTPAFADGICTPIPDCAPGCFGGSECVNGVCVCPPPPPPPEGAPPPPPVNFEYCSYACTDVLVDPNNCGLCGNICDDQTPGGAFCSAGTCTCPGEFKGLCIPNPNNPTIPPVCTDLTTNVNCGKCLTSCDAISGATCTLEADPDNPYQCTCAVGVPCSSKVGLVTTVFCCAVGETCNAGVCQLP